MGGTRTDCAGVDGATTTWVRYDGTWVEHQPAVQEWVEEQLPAREHEEQQPPTSNWEWKVSHEIKNPDFFMKLLQLLFDTSKH